MDPRDNAALGLRSHFEQHPLALIELGSDPLRSAGAIWAINDALGDKLGVVSFEGSPANPAWASIDSFFERQRQASAPAHILDVETLSPESFGLLLAKASRFCEEGGRVAISSAKPFADIAPDLARAMPQPLALQTPSGEPGPAKLAQFRARQPAPSAPGGAPKP